MTTDADITIDLVAAVRAVMERDLRLGIVNEDELSYRLIRGDRKKVVAQLKAEGLSNRKIAKALGVDPKTIGADLGVEYSTKSEEDSTPLAEPPLTQREFLDAISVYSDSATEYALKIRKFMGEGFTLNNEAITEIKLAANAWGDLLIGDSA